MSTNNKHLLYGGNGSPYSCKIRSYLRYKQIYFEWRAPTFAMGKWPDKFNHIKPKVIPVIVFPNGYSMNESTKIIQKIEYDNNNKKRLLITTNINNIYIKFINDLLEDFADEWCTKLMYGMRWNKKIDQDFGALYILTNTKEKHTENAAKIAKKRQVERIKIVGCHNQNEINDSFIEICNIFEEFLRDKNTENIFLFGSIPSSADFAFYGQMSQFRVDVTSNKILRDKYPYLICWLYKMDDLSGYYSTNKNTEYPQITNIIIKLLTVCGNIYLPFLKANYYALLNKKNTFNVNLLINGKTYNHKQKSFKWQAKCFKTLQDTFNRLKSDIKYDG
eukprot:120088_1